MGYKLHYKEDSTIIKGAHNQTVYFYKEELIGLRNRIGMICDKIKNKTYSSTLMGLRIRLTAGVSSYSFRKTKT